MNNQRRQQPGGFEVQITHLMTFDEIAHIAITAFEGGIGYWCHEVSPVELTASGWDDLTGDRYERWKTDGVGAYANPDFWASANHGYSVSDEEDCGAVLTADSIAKAVQKQPRERLARLINPGEYDAEDADCVVQTAIFGEIVYG